MTAAREEIPGETGLPFPIARVLGRVRGAAPGPTLLVVGGIHGNEPSGLRAAGRVLDELKGMTGGIRGEFVAVAGNLAALEANRRFLERDLNRQWSAESVAALRRANREDLDHPEDREQKELAEVFHGILEDARGQVYVLDLHTTSAAGAPFALPGDGPESFAWASGFAPTVILGLHEQMPGLLLRYLSGLGCVAVAMEGGQHLSPDSTKRHRAVIWVALARCGVVLPEDAPELAEQRALLEKARGDLPRAIEVYYRQAITAADEFVMEPGYSNLQRIRSGDLLAHDLRGEIRARKDDVLLMPLYQALGDDGFFLCREVELK